MEKNAVGSARRHRRFLATKHGTRLRLVAIGDVVSVAMTDGTVWLTTRDGARHPSFLSLSEIETCVDPAVLVRVSRTALINVDAVQEIERLHHGELILSMTNGERIRTGRRPKPLARLLMNDTFELGGRY